MNNSTTATPIKFYLAGKIAGGDANNGKLAANGRAR